MDKRTLLPVAALGLAALTASVAGGSPPRPVETHAYEIKIENLTKGQGFSPPVFFTHKGDMHLFEAGKKASLGICRIAEEGNNAPIMLMALGMKKHGKVGAVEAGLPIEPGKTGTCRIEVDESHPMVSGAWMLGMTNDGFSGIDCLDTMAVGEMKSMMLKGWDAGTEKNDERQADMIALMGPNRNPENGVIRAHGGIKGNKDAPKKWDFQGDVAKVTIRRVD